MDEFASFGVPRPDMMKTIFFFNLSHFASHFGIRTASNGKNVASITQPGVLLLLLLPILLLLLLLLLLSCD
jgi:hypothetical protein